jgi:hypothetical protein
MFNKGDKFEQINEGSIGIQANTINFHGLSYQTVKEIAQDIFEKNFYKLSSEAQNVAKQRADYILEDILKRLKQLEQDKFKSLTDPDVQYALFNIQKDFARSGSHSLREMLVELFISRVNSGERDLKQVILNEAIQVVPKLTQEQIDILTFYFIVLYGDCNVSNLEDFFNYLKGDIGNLYTRELVMAISNNSNFQHLAYAGCVTISIGSISIENILQKRFPWIYSKGFKMDEFIQCLKGLSEDKKNELKTQLLMNCLNEDGKFQFNALTEEDLFEQINIYLSDDEHIDIKTTLVDLFKNSQMASDEVIRVLFKFEENVPFIKNLITLWNGTKICNSTLTSVGIAIAHANMSRISNINSDLDIWLNKMI